MIYGDRSFLHQPAVEDSISLDGEQGQLFPCLLQTFLQSTAQFDVLDRGQVLILRQGSRAYGDASFHPVGQAPGAKRRQPPDNRPLALQ